MPYNAYGHHDGHCDDCGKVIPVYTGAGIANIGGGFVPPSPPINPGDHLRGRAVSAEEAKQIKFIQGSLGITASAQEGHVCRECYLTEFARIYPNEKPPRMPLDRDEG